MSPEAYLEMAATEEQHWWFAARRTILSSLLEQLRLPPRPAILELGCGTGGNLDMLSRFGAVSAMEMDDVARGIAQSRHRSRADIRAGSCPADIPFNGQQFDLVCLFDVLEHIDQDQQTLAAIRSLLAPAGHAVVTVPAYQWLWSRHDEVLHHKRRYTASELKAKAWQAGFRVERISYFNTLLFPLAAALRLKERLLGGNPGGTAVPPALVNSVFRLVFGSERHLLRSVNLPFGVSLVAILSPA
ncbi:class I SAM-dependent methyltransferase [Noviherbaspirillum sp. Root189]|uniref:class I SAM-dependent methyltransferase n=1 Tax=Noviherbaspirillum sp. Root189 TaxID=1736487 RepID=UPI00070EC0B2|nr:class I SAM-dependent methyltransferase [Noviherbaspirillum sp. Root189]KRB85135.1 methyltransferase [Noviherbaspirillum sp. Root189]